MAREKESRDEPQFHLVVEVDKMELCTAFNWYNSNRDREDSHRYLRAYCDAHGIEVTEDQIKNQVSTLGFTARMLSRGVILGEKDTDWFNRRMTQMQVYRPPVVVKKPKPVVPVEEKGPVEKAPRKPKAPRKKKAKAPEAQVKNLKYLSSENTLNITSIDPVKVIGASKLWTYHVPSRVLSCYETERGNGFEVKGCAILNFSKEQSKSKKLRKPEQFIPQVLTSSLLELKNEFLELSTKESPVTGRVNSQTLLLRVQ
jgi:hypothetical protein